MGCPVVNQILSMIKCTEIPGVPLQDPDAMKTLNGEKGVWAQKGFESSCWLAIFHNDSLLSCIASVEEHHDLYEQARKVTKASSQYGYPVMSSHPSINTDQLSSVLDRSS